MSSEIPKNDRHSGILIVEDSAQICRKLKGLLKESGIKSTISEAGNSIEALTSFKENLPSVVILDLQLNTENGIHLIRPFKRLNENVTIIILTNYPDDHYRKKCIENGADFFFSKYNETDQAIGICSMILKTESQNT